VIPLRTLLKLLPLQSGEAGVAGDGHDGDREGLHVGARIIDFLCGKRLSTCPMGEESCLGGFGKGPIAEQKLGSSGHSRPRKRVYRHSNALRMSQGRFLLPSDIGPHCHFPQQVLVNRRCPESRLVKPNEFRECFHRLPIRIHFSDNPVLPGFQYGRHLFRGITRRPMDTFPKMM